VRLYLGVDLGSTTSKAVLVDDDERVVGRGITNTRSNYDVAVEIARRDAMTDARLALALRLLGRDGHAVAEAFWVESDLHRLEALRQTCRATAAAVPGEGPRLAPAVDVILARIVDEAGSLFSAAARGRGSFFRDIVGARFHALAEEASTRAGLDFELVLGVYDRAILEAENQVIDAPFLDVFAAAVDRVGLEGARRTARSPPAGPPPGSSSSWSASSAPATAGPGCRSRATASAARSSATASAPTRCCRGPAPCSTSAARTPRRSRSTSAAWSPRSR
jgi:benzoyl-CoA reductase subunit A